MARLEARGKGVDEGILGGDFDRSDRLGLHTRVRDAEESAKAEVWASYRCVALADPGEASGLKIIDSVRDTRAPVRRWPAGLSPLSSHTRF